MHLGMMRKERLARAKCRQVLSKLLKKKEQRVFFEKYWTKKIDKAMGIWYNRIHSIGQTMHCTIQKTKKEAVSALREQNEA